MHTNKDDQYINDGNKLLDSSETYDYHKLTNIRNKIEDMNHCHQTQILKIIHDENKDCINENSYGIHINLTDLDKSIIIKLSNYIDYVNTQEKDINGVEKKKKEYIETYFNN